MEYARIVDLSGELTLSFVPIGVVVHPRGIRAAHVRRGCVEAVSVISSRGEKKGGEGSSIVEAGIHGHRDGPGMYGPHSSQTTGWTFIISDGSSGTMDKDFRNGHRTIQ